MAGSTGFGPAISGLTVLRSGPPATTTDSKSASRLATGSGPHCASLWVIRPRPRTNLAHAPHALSHPLRRPRVQHEPARGTSRLRAACLRGRRSERSTSAALHTRFTIQRRAASPRHLWAFSTVCEVCATATRTVPACVVERAHPPRTAGMAPATTSRPLAYTRSAVPGSHPSVWTVYRSPSLSSHAPSDRLAAEVDRPS
jgi:hypothetical protein